MSDKFEQKLVEWCNKSQTRNLEYLDLSLSQKPTLSEVACNIEVTYTKVCFLSKIVLEQFSHLQQETRKLQNEIKQLKTTIGSLEKEVYSQKPLGKKEVAEIILQPRVIDVETSQATKEVLTEVKRLQKIVVEVKRLIGG